MNTVQNRGRTDDIISQILDIANGAEDSTKTKLMYGAFISYNQLKEYLALLTEKDLLRYDSINQRYKITKKGKRLLQLCNELDYMTKKAS